MKTEDKYINVPGGTIYMRVWRPEGIQFNFPLILMHESLGSVGQWRSFPADLAERLTCPVIAYDRLGFGKSTPLHQLPGFNFIEDEARSIVPRIIEEMGIEKFWMFGHSVGGGMSLITASVMQNKCIGVISESAQAFIEERTLEGIRDAKIEFQKPVNFNRLVKWHGDKAQWVLDAWTEVWLSAGMRGWKIDKYLTDVKCPVLTIHGDQDEFGSAEFPRRIAGGVNGLSEMIILEKCGHVPHRERKQEILDLVESFYLKYIVNQK